MSGLSRTTFEPIDDIDHINQCLECIFNTPQGTRVMREWFGNPGLKYLGKRNLNDETILLMVNCIYALISLFEPRVELKGFVPESVQRSGTLEMELEVEYRPHAHLGWQQARLFVAENDGRITVRRAI